MSEEKQSLNILRDAQWIKTNAGSMSPLEVFLSRDPLLNLDEEVPGYVYGAQYRFLMTIYALLAKEDLRTAENGSLFQLGTIEKVISILDPYADLFSPDNPFLQVVPEDISTEIEGGIRKPDQMPGKILPEGQTPDSNQVKFWDIGADESSFNINKAILALVSYYFYGTGTNTGLTQKYYTQLTNGSSALQYLTSVEIIPQGEGLLESLSMSVPKSFIENYSFDLLPHWASRRDGEVRMNDPLWRFSWSGNTVYCHFNEEKEELLLVKRGAIPVSWTAAPPPLEGEKWAKTYHSLRQIEDPLYLYRIVDESPKLWRASVTSDPYFAVAQWHFEQLSENIKSKLIKSVAASDDKLLDLVMLEHSTEGASSSFNIRYSKVVRGWKDELIPPEGLNNLQTVASNVLAMKRRLTGLFSEKGTCSHLNPRRDDVENEYWGRVQSVLEDMVHKDLELKEANTRIKKAAIEAYEAISSIRDISNIKAHMVGLQILQSHKIGD